MFYWEIGQSRDGESRNPCAKEVHVQKQECKWTVRETEEEREGGGRERVRETVSLSNITEHILKIAPYPWPTVQLPWRPNHRSY